MSNYTKEDFNINELGCLYSSDKTFFRVFAPDNTQISLIINNYEYQMHKNGCIFEIGLKGNLENIKYHYRNEEGINFKDPFAYYSDENDSFVLDINKFNLDIVKPSECLDPIIYETSVRDFSSNPYYNGLFPKKIKALCQENLKLHDYFVIGLDYLKNIGITHLQLMPILAYDKDNSEYNWGYNPIAFNYVSKEYIHDDTNPYAYINEVRETINSLHKNNIRVTLDVVFNHAYKADEFDLNKMLKGNAFRYLKNGNLAQGSFCGNEIKSEDAFIREYLAYMIERYILLFDIDGIRLDLMGLMDIDTLNYINSKAKAIKKDFIIYGEGWRMSESLDDSKAAIIENSSKVKEVKFFNDYFRDTIIKYVCGDLGIAKEVTKVLSGINNNLSNEQTINYVECHDNYTFYDRLLKRLPDESFEIRKDRCRLALALVVLAKGTPFIHSGQEFLRSKKLFDNSYNLDDTYNCVDWNARVMHNDLCDYLKDLILFRKNHIEFVDNRIIPSFSDYYGCIVYNLGNLRILINSSDYEHIYADDDNYQVLFDYNGFCNYQSDAISIKSHSLVICKKLI